MYVQIVQASRVSINNESLALLKLARIVLNLIENSPFYIESVIFLCIFAGNWAGKQVHSTAITLSSPMLSLL